MRLRAIVMIALAAAAPAAAAQKKPAARKPAPTLQELVLAGRTAEAVKGAARNPAGVADTFRSILGLADADANDQNPAEAKKKLDALQGFLEAWTRTGKGKDLPREALAARQLRVEGILLANEKEYARAEEVDRRALEMAKKAGDATLEAAIHNHLGHTLLNQAETNDAQADEKLEAAAREFDTARKMGESQKDSYRAGASDMNLGQTLLQLKRPDPALEAFRRAEAQFNALGNASLEARSVLYQGIALGRINPVAEEPVKVFDRAYRSFQKLGEDSYAGWSLLLAADHTAYLQKPAEAANLGERAIPFLVKAGSTARLRACYALLGEMFSRTGDTAKAEKYRSLAAETTGPQ